MQWRRSLLQEQLDGLERRSRNVRLSRVDQQPVGALDLSYYNAIRPLRGRFGDALACCSFVPSAEADVCKPFGQVPSNVAPNAGVEQARSVLRGLWVRVSARM